MEQAHNEQGHANISVNEHLNIVTNISSMTLATLYIKISNHHNLHATAKQKLESDFLVRLNNYPTNLTMAQNITFNYKHDNQSQCRPTGNMTHGVLKPVIRNNHDGTKGEFGHFE